MRLLLQGCPQSAGASCRLQRGAGSSAAFLPVSERSTGQAGRGRMAVARHACKESVLSEKFIIVTWLD